eukprot:705040-Alexandrium_andersonii.AAC.1
MLAARRRAWGSSPGRATASSWAPMACGCTTEGRQGGAQADPELLVHACRGGAGRPGPLVAGPGPRRP